MPPQKRPKNKEAPSMASGVDRISALPDAVLHHVLSFLQAREAVRSCVLARRFRHLWKSMPVLRVTGGRPVQESHKFLDHLLLLRDRSPLDACLFDFGGFSDGDVPYVNLWIRCALLRQVQVLSVACRWYGFPVSGMPLVSQSLTELELDRQCLNAKFLDFSSCPALEELKMTKCSISSDKISSRSLKRLSIRECSFSCVMRTRISVPSLISLQLTTVKGRTPLLEDMPVLVSATVRFDNDCEDSCDSSDAGYCSNDSSEECCGTDDGSASCVLLKGLSAATNLKLIAKPEVFILKKDLRWCPTFSKLKTLLLNEGCVGSLFADQSALICILQHSPVLENLTLQLSETPERMFPTKATYNLLEQSFSSDNLKIVEVACQEVDQKVHNIMKSLSTYGIPLEKISIQQTNKSYECFNFVCTGFSSKEW